MRRVGVHTPCTLPSPLHSLNSPHVPCVWLQLQAQGQLTLEGTGAVPDAYARVQELEDVIKVRPLLSLSSHCLRAAYTFHLRLHCVLPRP